MKDGQNVLPLTPSLVESLHEQTIDMLIVACGQFGALDVGRESRAVVTSDLWATISIYIVF